jgi:hypothetical protein
MTRRAKLLETTFQLLLVAVKLNTITSISKDSIIRKTHRPQLEEISAFCTRAARTEADTALGKESLSRSPKSTG